VNVDIHPVRCASSQGWTVYEPCSAEPVAEASTKLTPPACCGIDTVGNLSSTHDVRPSYASSLHSTGDKVGVVTYRYDAAGTRATKRGRDVDVTYFGLYELERRGMTLYERLAIPTPAGVVAQLERSGADGQTASRLRWRTRSPGVPRLKLRPGVTPAAASPRNRWASAGRMT
jgi:hypothetical protein